MIMTWQWEYDTAFQDDKVLLVNRFVNLLGNVPRQITRRKHLNIFLYLITGSKNRAKVYHCEKNA